MARKPLRPCNKYGCRNLTNDRYCQDHQKIAKEKQRIRHRFYDKYKRDKEAAAFYKSKSWDLMRVEALRRDHGLCQCCLKEKEITYAEMVDHIIPIKIDWSLRLTLSNLQSLCNACHAIKTAEDKRKYGDKL